MGTPFSVSASLNLPGDAGLPPEPIPVNFSAAFDSAAEFVFNFSGSGTRSVNLGTTGGAGLKGLLVKVDPSASAQPILAKFNGASQGVEIAPGGFILYGNPVPAAGVTQLDLVYTTACVVRVWALG